MKFFITVTLMLLSFKIANAKISCETDEFNNKHCQGTDPLGNDIKLVSYTDSSGNIVVKGTVGDVDINFNSKIDKTGMIQTSGTIDGKELNTTSQVDSSGNIQSRGIVDGKELDMNSVVDSSGEIQVRGTYDGQYGDSKTFLETSTPEASNDQAIDSNTINDPYLEND